MAEIKISDINTGMDTTGQRSLDQQDARDWIGNISGEIKLSEFSGISWPVKVTGVNITSGNWSHSGAVGATHQIAWDVLPPNATIKDVTFQSNNTSVATVSATGLVTARGRGSATITIRTVDGGFTDTMTATISIDANLSLPPTPAGWGASNLDEMRIRNDNPDAGIIRFAGHSAWRNQSIGSTLNPGATNNKVVDIGFPLDHSRVGPYWYEVWFEDPNNSSNVSPKTTGSPDNRF